MARTEGQGPRVLVHRAALHLLLVAAPLCAQGLLCAQESRPTASILRDLDSNKYQVARRAVLAARESLDKAFLDKLIELVEHSRNINIRGFAAETLGYYRDPRIFPALKKLAADGPYGARFGALPGLGRLKDPRSFDVLVKELGPRGQWGHAATGLRLLGDKRAVPHLTKIFRANVHDHRAHGELADAIVALDPNAAVDLFFEAILNPKAYVGYRLAVLLGGIKTDAVRKRAEKLLGHESIKVRTAGLRILGGAGNVKTVAVLLGVMERDEEVRLEAVLALGQLGHELAVPQIARHLDSDDDKLRTAAAASLGRIGHRTAVLRLVAALRNEEETMPKLRMIEALGRIGDKQAVSELGRHLEDETMERQPMRMSSIALFPWNTPVDLTVWWSLRRIRDGKEPMPLGKMLCFPRPRAGVEKEIDLDAVRRWWARHKDDPGYSCPGR